MKWLSDHKIFLSFSLVRRTCAKIEWVRFWVFGACVEYIWSLEETKDRYLRKRGRKKGCNRCCYVRTETLLSFLSLSFILFVMEPSNIIIGNRVEARFQQGKREAVNCKIASHKKKMKQNCKRNVSCFPLLSFPSCFHHSVRVLFIYLLKKSISILFIRGTK